MLKKPTQRLVSTCRRVAALIVLSLAASVLPAQAADDESTSACPGEEAWKAAHSDSSNAAMNKRDAARTPSRPDLLEELRRRAGADQTARRVMLAHPGDDAAVRAVTQVDDDDVAWLTRLLKRDGFPHVDQIGEVGLHLVWVLVQHADRDPPLQRLVLKAFERLHAANEVSADDLARLTDRLLVNQNKPQRYGTQFDWASGRFDPKNIADAEVIDGRRRELGLMPLADFACVINRALARGFQ
jgi:hypothetical protein